MTEPEQPVVAVPEVIEEAAAAFEASAKTWYRHAEDARRDGTVSELRGHHGIPSEVTAVVRAMTWEAAAVDLRARAEEQPVVAQPLRAGVLARHVEPHDCPREGPWSACDFNQLRGLSKGDSRIAPATYAMRHAKVMEAIEVSWQDSGYAGSARLSRAAHAAATAVLAALVVTEPSHVGSPTGYAAYPLDLPHPTIEWAAVTHDAGCCASRGCHKVCSHLCGTDLHSCDGTPHPEGPSEVREGPLALNADQMAGNNVVRERKPGGPMTYRTVAGKPLERSS